MRGYACAGLEAFDCEKQLGCSSRGRRDGERRMMRTGERLARAAGVLGSRAGTYDGSGEEEKRSKEV